MKVCSVVAAMFAAHLAACPTWGDVTFYEFDTDRAPGSLFQEFPLGPDPFDQSFDGVSSWTLTGRAGDVQSLQFGAFEQEYGLQDVTRLSADITINPGNEATALGIALLDYSTTTGAEFDEVAEVFFDLSGLGPGTHRVEAPITIDTLATAADLNSIEAVKPKYFPGETGPVIDVTIDRISAADGTVAFLQQDFQNTFPGSLPAANFESVTNVEAGFSVSDQASVAFGVGAGGTPGVRLVANAASAAGAEFWNAELISTLDFRNTTFPFSADQLQFEFDAKGSEAATIELEVRTWTDGAFNDTPGEITGVLQGTVDLSSANQFENVVVSVSDFNDVTAPEQSGFDLNTDSVQFIWRITGDSWGFDNGNELVLDNVVLRAVDVPTAAEPGDFNNDGVVDAADYTVWRDNLNAPDETPINNAGNGLFGVDPTDYGVWTSNFGNASSSAVAAPEPTAAAMLTLLALCVASIRSRS